MCHQTEIKLLKYCYDVITHQQMRYSIRSIPQDTFHKYNNLIPDSFVFYSKCKIPEFYHVFFQQKLKRRRKRKRSLPCLFIRPFLPFNSTKISESTFTATNESYNIWGILCTSSVKKLTGESHNTVISGVRIQHA